MCMSCGCREPNNDHGDKRHITLDELDQAAQAANISREEAARNILDTLQQAGASSQQSQQA